MSYKTDRLTALFSDAYGARDKESVLYKLLDAFGAELMRADARVKDLLKSHWVRHADGPALDALGSVFGIERRTLRTGEPEPDSAFRRRLQTEVPFFTGGGTVEAVKGTVRSALGLPFDLDDLGIPEEFAALRADIESLVQLHEFSPIAERVTGASAAVDDNFSEAALVFDIPSVGESFPRLKWTFVSGSGRLLRVERLGSGLGAQSVPGFVVAAGATLVLTADADGRLNASIGNTDHSSSFTNLDGSTPARLPAIPEARSEWRLRASGALFDLSTFDGVTTFDPPAFQAELSRIRLQRLMFDVQVPFFLQEAVAQLKSQFAFPGELLVYEALPPERIQEVINQTAAAGVRASLRFSLNFFEAHPVSESFSGRLGQRVTEDAGGRDSLLAANVNQLGETQNATENFALGGLFDFSTFDGSFGYQ